MKANSPDKAGVTNLLASLGHTGRVGLGHTLHTQTLTKTDGPKKKRSMYNFHNIHHHR